MKDVQLDFYFDHPYAPHKSMGFSQPVDILTTTNINDVRDIIQRVEAYNEKGYYAAGYISYEAAPAFNSKMKVHTAPEMPLIWFGIFEEPANIPEYSQDTDAPLLDWQPDTDKEDYHQAIKTIKSNIEEGNTYQVNHTIRLTSSFKGDSKALFTRLQKAQQAKFCARLKLPDQEILSASPELFFAKQGNGLQAKPMKGTIKRGKSWEEDQENRAYLESSEKEQAENVMIVDLLRNDLGKISVPGTVIIPEIFNIEQYPTVYQMTSTIESEMMPSTRYVDLFEALFPCGSITGAPKLKTMSIIKELEPSPRDVYCGAIGYFTPEKTAIFNVPIRTVWIDKATNKATYGVGGGITWESTAEAEYEEVLAKGKVLHTKWPTFRVLESLLLHDGDYWLLENHLERLERSVSYFGYPFEKTNIKSRLETLAMSHPKGVYKVRLLLGMNADITVEAMPIKLVDGVQQIALASEPIDKEDLFFYHKTTNRTAYEKLKKSDVFDTLLWNKDGELTEFINGNLVCVINGEQWTPPVECGLLPGTFRQHLLEKGEIKEKVLLKKDLNCAESIWFINSVRGWVEVKPIDNTK